MANLKVALTNKLGNGKNCRKAVIRIDQRKQEAERLSTLASEAKEKGDLETAIALYGKAVLADQMNERAINNIGVIYQMCGEIDTAKFYFERVVNINPGNAPALYNLGTCLFQEGNAREAKICFLESIRLGYPAGHYFLSWIYRDQHQYRMAAICLKLFIEKDPEHPSVPDAKNELQKIISEHKEIGGMKSLTI